jgi:single-strand selective monofunctional uracil DNA glycosylase
VSGPPPPRPDSAALVEASRALADALAAVKLGGPVRCVYNPLLYARRPWEAYLSRYGGGPKRVVFVGMNPGPWGMAQTGVPFGEVVSVREWLGIREPVDRPAQEHPKRRVEGFAVSRSEASGRRLWGLMRERFGSPEAFFRQHFVANYCPLLFLDREGRNVTPDKLPKADRAKVFPPCDEHLKRVVEILEPEWLIGIGRFTEARIRALYSQQGSNGPEEAAESGAAAGAPPPRGGGRGRRPQGSPRIAGILHPSPASPRANRGWAEQVTGQLIELGVW